VRICQLLLTSEKGRNVAYVAMLPGAVLPVMSLSQASLHSRTTSMAYLQVSAMFSRQQGEKHWKPTSCSCTRQ
jgi:hypothetical protein